MQTNQPMSAVTQAVRYRSVPGRELRCLGRRQCRAWGPWRRLQLHGGAGIPAELLLVVPLLPLLLQLLSRLPPLLPLSLLLLLLLLVLLLLLLPPSFPPPRVRVQRHPKPPQSPSSGLACTPPCRNRLPSCKGREGQVL